MGWVPAAAKRVYDGRRGQASIVGLALVVAMVILGTVAIVTFGNAAIDGAEDQSRLTRAEHSMTLFDSKAAQVGLGDTQVHTVDFGSDAGNYDVDESAGTISIIQLDYDDNGANDDGDDAVTTTYSGTPGTEDDVYIMSPQPLGALVHETDDAKIAYQGGGVWRKGAGGGVSMVSPPEFHYRGLTLTLPVIQTKGSGSVTGTASATIEDSNTEVPVFPHPTKTYDHTGAPFQNPVEKGEVVIEIQSEYAEGWGEYFSERTEGEVTYPAPNTVRVKLVSLGNLGDFQMPGDGGHVVVPGASDGHNSEDFSIRIRPDDSDSANFANLQWSFYVDTGSQQFEIHIKKSGGGGGCSGGTTSTTADLTVYYSNDGGSTYEGWHEPDAYQAKCANLDPSDPADEIYFDIDFIDDEDGDTEWDDVESGDPVMTYQSLSSSDLQHFNPSGATLDSSPQFDEHSGSVSWETVDPTTTTMTPDRLLNHYFGLLPNDFHLTVDDKNSDTTNEAVSGGTLNSAGSGKYVTYLHVTRNEIKVTVD